jgi:ribonuclease Y
MFSLRSLIPAPLRDQPEQKDAELASVQVVAEVAGDELGVRREEIARMEERALRDLESAAVRLREAERRVETAEAQQSEVAAMRAELEAGLAAVEAELERLAGVTGEEARLAVLTRAEEEAARQAGLIIKRIEDEARLEGERRARAVLAVATQRLAPSHSIQTNTQTIQLPNEEMKGRIIGKEGRNIRTLQGLTGVDIIIDETPETVVLSSFDGVRREVARLTLERLIADGRIHPAAIEAAFESAEAEIEDVMVKAAESALLDARVAVVEPEIVRLLGRLKFRTSFSQNVLDHLVECSHLAALIAAELGASVEIARRAALLHDIGKAVSHEVEGTHAAVGARIAARCGESDEVVHAIEAHHGEVEPATVEAVIVQAADALSGARPGARGDSLENYVSRLGDLEALALRHEGVRKAYAMQAGREIRVVVDPVRVDDQTVAVLSHEIATAIETEMQYPGQIKVTVVRELRSTRVAQ